ncbi:IclR family transcriptional regulator C-terminal domain-containing protein, partial [Salmonella enterica]|uniref:IclR family transcriptional regulator C-terminal domain-containing protein n=1 Tax=Salmonella enterica TaxID=28901 RepID=UPI0020C1FFBD
FLFYMMVPIFGLMRSRCFIGNIFPLYWSEFGFFYMAFVHPDYVESYWESHIAQIQQLSRNAITVLPGMFDVLAKIR